jgi:outer membrane murein-binding lipoprotein Lpp
MADICSKCGSSFINPKDILECCECRRFFHPTCTKVRTLENFRKLGARKTSWKCDECKDKSPVMDSNDLESTLTSTIRDALTQVFNDKFNELNSIISTLNSTVESLKSSLEILREENKSVNEQCKKLENENKKLRRDMNEIQQYTRLDNVEIVGIPETKNENIYMILESVAKVINTPFKRDEISIAHRVPSAKNKTTSIIVRFTSRTAKINWKRAAKTKGHLKTSDLNCNLPPGNIYVNDHLTAHNKFLLNKAKDLKKNNKLAFVWVSDAKILIRKKQDSPVKRISSEDDLKSFE